MANHTFTVIGAACGWGGRRRKSERGPSVLEDYALVGKLTGQGVKTTWHSTIKLPETQADYGSLTPEETLPFVTRFNRELISTIKALPTSKDSPVPIVVGGDHSVAMGTWSAITSARGVEGKFGLIWLDAHLDAHTPATAHEGRWGGYYHGRPVAVLLGHGEPELTGLGSTRAKISPQNLTIIGARSYEAGEQKLLESLGVRIVYMDEVRRRGFAEVFAEAMQRATNGTSGFGLSIDLDGFDPSEAPGTGTNEENGLHANEVLPVLKGVGQHPACCGIEVAEFHPDRDVNNYTANLVVKLLQAVGATA